MLWNLFKPSSPPSSPRVELGERGEQFAARHLRRQGYKILVRRYRSRAGELDIIARHQDTLVFVEVKTRASEQFGPPGAAVDQTKQRHMTKVAADYVRRLENRQVKTRFDVVEVVMNADDPAPRKIRVFQDAFEAPYPYLF
ncbi:YraN family protein [bacterium]|nr:YraN family protein [bacterium]